MNVLDIKNLTYAYTMTMGGKHHVHAVLQDLSLSIAEGESVGLIGANGVGKSTLLKLITGLLELQQGSITVANTALSKSTLKEIRKNIGYVFQDSDSQLFMSTVEEDIAFGPQNYGYSTQDVQQRVQRALQAVGMEKLRERQIYRLSGGEKKLVSIATVLAMESPLILLDEPTVALDPRNRRTLIGIVNNLSCAKLIATHDLDFVLDTCSRTVLLNRGGVLHIGPTQELLRNKELLENNGLELPLSLTCR